VSILKKRKLKIAVRGRGALLSTAVLEQASAFGHYRPTPTPRGDIYTYAPL